MTDGEECNSLKSSLELQTAMAEQHLFGEESTADIKLQLIGADGGEYQRNPLYLHSEVLVKSEFYKTLLTKRWSSDKKRPLEIEITSRHSGKIYIKCIQFMYKSHASEPLCFSNVEEALGILAVASELMFQECMEECMRYLNAVPWGTKQEVKLRALLLSLEINTSADLATRLGMSQCKSDHGALQIMEQFLENMLSAVSGGSERHSQYIEEYIVAHFEENTSFARSCRSALLKKFAANVERAKHEIPNSCYALSRIVRVIERCDGRLFEPVLRMFCEEAEIPKAVNRCITYDYSYQRTECSNRVVGIMDPFLKALGNGRVVTSTSFRVSFLTNWVAVIANLKDLDKLAISMVDVAETLPPLNQRDIYNIWNKASNRGWYMGDYTRHKIDDWSKRVHDAIDRQNVLFHLNALIRQS